MIKLRPTKRPFAACFLLSGPIERSIGPLFGSHRWRYVLAGGGLTITSVPHDYVDPVADLAPDAPMLGSVPRPRDDVTKPAMIAFMAIVDAWLLATPSPDIATLVAATRLSRRQIERRCNALYGAPPKLLARKHRALRAAIALAGGARTVDTIVADGFYDQSHLIRELKQFTGLTPRRIRDDPGLLAHLSYPAPSAGA